MSEVQETAAEIPVVLVTGAARGIGKAIALRCLEAGLRVLAVDRDAEGLDALAEVSAGDGGARLATLTGDLLQVETAVAAVGRAVDTFGRLDSIVSNAGTNRYAPLSEVTVEDWHRVLDTNLTAAFLLAKAGEAALRAAKGSMVLIASTRALMSEPDTFAYSASKGGLVALGHSLAMSLGPDVRVNTISPGWIDHGKHGPLGPEDHQQHPAGRVGRPEDVAELAIYLIDGSRSGFMTGANLTLDGGMTRKMIYME